MGGKAISTVGILGAGLMGHGIAQIFASRGFRVRIHDVDRAMLEAVPQRIRDNFQVFVELGLARPEDVSDCWITSPCAGTWPVLWRTPTWWWRPSPKAWP